MGSIHGADGFFSLGIPTNYEGRSNNQTKGSCDEMYQSGQERVRKQRLLIFQDLSMSEKVHVYREIRQHLIYTCENAEDRGSHDEKICSRWNGREGLVCNSRDSRLHRYRHME